MPQLQYNNIRTQDVQQRVEEFFGFELKKFIREYKTGHENQAPSKTEITDYLDGRRLDQFKIWVADKVGADAGRYANIAQQSGGRKQSLFEHVETRLVDRFLANPNDFVAASEYSVDTKASKLQPPKPQSVSNQRILQHYADLPREYRSNWVADPKVIVLQGLLTLGLDVVELGKKSQSKDIPLMLGFLPKNTIPGILNLYDQGVKVAKKENEISEKGAKATSIDKAELENERKVLDDMTTAMREALRGTANSICSEYHISAKLNKAQDLFGLKPIKAYLVKMTDEKGDYIFKELRDLGIKDDGSGPSIPKSWIENREERLDGIGAKLSAWLNHNLALSTMNLIQEFVLIPKFTQVAKYDTPDTPKAKDPDWAEALHNILYETHTKEFASGSASHEAPPSPELEDWYLRMMNANRMFPTNFYYYGHTNLKHPDLSEYVAEPVDYLAVIYPQMIGPMANAMIEEDQRRGASGKFHDALYSQDPKTPGLFSILTNDGGSYKLDRNKRADFYAWIQDRKKYDPDDQNYLQWRERRTKEDGDTPDKTDFENPDHPITWYLNLKSIRFTGTGADVSTRVKVEMLDSVVHDSKTIVNVKVTSVSGGSDDQDLITPGAYTPVTPDWSTPTGNLMAAIYRSDNGELIKKLAGFEVPNTNGQIVVDMSNLPDETNRTESINPKSIDREPKNGVPGRGKIERIYDFGLTTGAEDMYYVYTTFPYVKADGTFKVQAGVDLKDFVTEEMQRSNAGKSISRFTPHDYKIRVRKQLPEEVDWSHVDFRTNKVDHTAGTMQISSNEEIVEKVPLFHPDGTTPILGITGQQVVKSKVVIMPNPLTGGSHGVFTVKLGNLLVSDEFPMRKLAIPVVETDANGNAIQMTNTDVSGKTTPRYQLLDELPASHMPVGIIGIGAYGHERVVNYDTGEVTAQDGGPPFCLIANEGRPVRLTMEDEDKGPLAGGGRYLMKKLNYNGQTVALVTYRTSLDSVTHQLVQLEKCTISKDFMQAVMSVNSELKPFKDLFIKTTTLNENGAMGAIDLNWSGRAFFGIALDAEKWAETDVQAKSFLSFITPWDVQLVDVGGKPGKNIPLVVGELLPGSPGFDKNLSGHQLILSYRFKDDAGVAKNIDVFRAYEKDGGWQCAPIQEFDSGGNPQGDYKLFLQGIGVLPKPEEKKDGGELRDGHELRDGNIRRVVPRRTRGS